MSAREPLLAVDGLGIALPGGTNVRRLFHDLRFSVAHGEVLAIVGQSGCGKTTLARAVVRLLPPHVAEIRGNVFLNGRAIYELDATELREVRRREMRIVFQDPAAALNPTVKVGRQVLPAVGRHGEKRAAHRADAIALLRQLEIDDPERCLEAYPFELSGGMKQRVLIASGLLTNPSLIVADEPTSSLDPVLRNRVLEMFLELARARGAGILLITHDLPLIARYADRALVLEEGAIVDTGSSRETLRSSRYSPVGMPSARPAGTGGHREGGDTVLHLERVSVDVAGRRTWPWQPRKRARILHDIDLDVRRGEILGLLGPSGAGKTTLARCILGLLEPSSGSVATGRVVRGPGRSRQRAATAGSRVQIIYQNPYSSLSPKLSIRSIVLEPLRSIAGIGDEERESRFRRIMRDVGLGPEYGGRRPAELSGGQRQRVAIARCLIADPALVVADEPVSSLDARACDQVLELLARLRDSYGFACLLISHDLGVLRVIADRIAVMERGRIVECGDTWRIFESPGHPLTADFVAATLPASGQSLS